MKSGMGGSYGGGERIRKRVNEERVHRGDAESAETGGRRGFIDGRKRRRESAVGAREKGGGEFEGCWLWVVGGVLPNEATRCGKSRGLGVCAAGVEGRSGGGAGGGEQGMGWV